MAGSRKVNRSFRIEAVIWERIKRVAKARRMTQTAVIEYGMDRALAELEAEVDAAGITPVPLPVAPSLTLPGVAVEPALPPTGRISRGREPRRQTG